MKRQMAVWTGRMDRPEIYLLRAYTDMLERYVNIEFPHYETPKPDRRNNAFQRRSNSEYPYESVGVQIYTLIPLCALSNHGSIRLYLNRRSGEDRRQK